MEHYCMRLYFFATFTLAGVLVSGSIVLTSTNS
jgi:hypothetical protein